MAPDLEWLSREPGTSMSLKATSCQYGKRGGYFVHLSKSVEVAMQSCGDVRLYAVYVR